MHFPASASFNSSAMLVVPEIFAVQGAKTRHEIPLAVIPLIFFALQLAEGVIWLITFDRSDSNAVRIPAYLLLFMATVWWPIRISLSALCLEQRLPQRRVLWFLCALGALLSVYLAGCLFYVGATAEVTGQHINYRCPYPASLFTISCLIYGVVTIIPALVCGSGFVPLLGCAIAASYISTEIMYDYYMISVWCYLSAIISVMVLLVLGSTNGKRDQVPNQAFPARTGGETRWRIWMMVDQNAPSP